MIKNSIRKIVVVTCLLFLKKKPYHRDIASLFLLNESFNYSLMKFKQNYWHFLPIIDMIESYKLDSPKEFI